MTSQLLWFILAGFIAEMVCGTLGMGYGVSATTLLLATGVAPVIASAIVHASEVVTMGMSALAHYKVGNVSREIVRRLLVPGLIGAVAGVFVLASVPAGKMRPWVAGYLLLMGVLIVIRGIGDITLAKPHHARPIGFIGGVLDSVGGGGFGTIVTGTLLAVGYPPRTTVGSVNFTRFFVSIAATIAFAFTVKMSTWTAAIGLAIGGAIAAPIAAIFAKRIPARPLTIAVGLLVIGLSVRTIVLALR